VADTVRVAPAGWIERLGAALAAPTRALAASETSAGTGRAPADLAVLILAAFMASHLPLLVKIGWLVKDGTGMDGVHLLLADLSAALMTPLLFVVVAGIAVTVLAGQRRQTASDFDLACVAAVPLAAVPPLVQLAARFGVAAPLLSSAATWLAFGWGGALAVLAVRQARMRRPGGAS
jgi:hypothetical protein